MTQITSSQTISRKELDSQRRWNGWGNQKTNKKVSVLGAKLIKAHIGVTKALPSATLKSVIAKVPTTRIPKSVLKHSFVSANKETRVRHARGQSFADWIAMRSGDFGVFPDAVAFPTSTEEVVTLLALAEKHDFIVIPYGGGTSVAGHINPQMSEKAILTVSMSKMSSLISFDEDSLIATFGAGTAGPAVELALSELGYTLGHYPQSWELSTLGGWVASRSSGQQSLRYGRIEQMFAGGTLVTPEGIIEIPDIPASSAGPDLREMMMGTEGRAGIFTEVKVRVRPLAEEEIFRVVFLQNWQAGKAVLKQAVQSQIPLSMLRLSNAKETNAHLHLGTSRSQFMVLDKYLKARGLTDEKVMLTYGVTGNKTQNKATLKQLTQLLKQHDAVGGKLANVMGKIWAHGRFKFPYLRGTMWKKGIMVDTFETATNWNLIDEQMASMEEAVEQALTEKNEKIMVFTHLSHIYNQGASIYTTYFFRAAEDYDETLARWNLLKQAANQSVASGKATVSHQHGVGRDHMPYLEVEKGELGLKATASMIQSLDPSKRMNPGVLLED